MVFDTYTRFCRRCNDYFKTRARTSQICSECKVIPKKSSPQGVRPEKLDWVKIKKIMIKKGIITADYS